MAEDSKIRPGTGKVLKYFRVGNEPMTGLKNEIAELTDGDLAQLVSAIDGDGNY